MRVLQQMLVDKAFKGYENTSENWVLNITSLSGGFQWDYKNLFRWHTARGWKNDETYMSAAVMPLRSYNL